MRDTASRAVEAVESVRFRTLVGAAIEALVDLLDGLDPDPDIELDSDGEPALGWREERRGQGACPTSGGEAETGSWPEHPNQQHIAGSARHHEDEEETALERRGEGFIPSGPDDSEDSDPGGGDILDQPHDDEDGYGGIFADADAVDHLRDEIAFQRWMDNSRPARFKAHEATCAQITKVTGREPVSHWSYAARIMAR